MIASWSKSTHYNIPRKIRELQFLPFDRISIGIITYQEKLGNYNYSYEKWSS